MIMGIISLLLCIGGFFLFLYGNDDGNLIMLTLGMIMCAIGIIGLIAFIGINSDTIRSWFTI